MYIIGSDLGLPEKTMVREKQLALFVCLQVISRTFPFVHSVPLVMEAN